MANNYLQGVISSLKGTGVLLPVLKQFLDKEALATSKDSAQKKRIVQKDAILSIRAMRNRYSDFAHGQKRPQFAFHPSALGQCLRKLWFEQFNAPKDRRHKDDVLQSYLIFEFGSYIHLLFQNLCERAGILLHREFRLLNLIKEIEGTCDGILSIQGKKYVLEIKSINSGQWTKVQQAPKFDHKQQVHAYMYVLGIKSCIIVYINKDRGTVKEFVVDFDEEFFNKSVSDRIAKYKGHVTKRTLPDREGTNPSTFPCSFCSFASLCFSPDSVKDFCKKLK